MDFNDYFLYVVLIVFGYLLFEANKKILETKKQIAETEKQIAETKRILDDSKYTLPPRYLEKAKYSSVIILNSDDEFSGIGFFVSENIVITVLHNLKSYSRVKENKSKNI